MEERFGAPHRRKDLRFGVEADAKALAKVAGDGSAQIGASCKARIRAGGRNRIHQSGADRRCDRLDRVTSPEIEHAHPTRLHLELVLFESDHRIGTEFTQAIVHGVRGGTAAAACTIRDKVRRDLIRDRQLVEPRRQHFRLWRRCATPTLSRQSP